MEYLKSRKEKKLLQDDLRELDSDEISFMELLDDAMEGVSVVVAAVSRVDEPQLQRCVSLLRELIREAAPHFPELITIPSTLHDIVETSTFDIQSVTFYDLADLLSVDQQNYPQIKLNSKLNSRVQIKFTAKRALIDKLQNF